MSREPLPETLDLRRLADRGASFEGTLPLRAMPRLGEALVHSDGLVEATLRLGRDAVGRATVGGRARVEVELLCQRCLESYRQPLRADFELVQVRGEGEAERLPEAVEPLLSDEDAPLRTAALIEDELILALPIVAAHPDPASCEPKAAAAATEHEQSVGPARENPFAVLARLKKDER